MLHFKVGEFVSFSRDILLKVLARWHIWLLKVHQIVAGNSKTILNSDSSLTNETGASQDFE